MKRSILAELVAARESRRAVVLLTWLDGSRQEVCAADGLIGEAELQAAARSALRSDRASVHEEVAGNENQRTSIFVQPFNPPLRLLIVGAVHIGQHLAVMARSARYDVTVIDPRAAFATAERFPGVALRRQWPDAALERLALDARTAVVTLTHDPKLDDPALRTVLESEVFYIGSLGSRRTHAQRLERLREIGVDEASLRRIHGPAGLDIGARSPAEIAVSILAEITETLRGKS